VRAIVSRGSAARQSWREEAESFARDVADEICFLHDGRILERGKPARLLSHPEQPETQRFLRRLLEAGRL
jgi:ABC-type histidine transport system ATPase subunit